MGGGPVGWGLNTAIPLLLGVSFLIWKMPFIAHLGQLLPLNVILGASVDNVNMTWYTWKKFTALTSKSNIAQHSAIPGWLCWATQENALDCKCKDSSSSPLNLYVCPPVFEAICILNWYRMWSEFAFLIPKQMWKSYRNKKKIAMLYFLVHPVWRLTSKYLNLCPKWIGVSLL